MNESIGQYVHKLRVENNLTLTQLGAILGIDSGALSKIENERRSLDCKYLPKLAAHFTLDLEKLRKEYFSEKFANEIIEKEISTDVLRLVKLKLKKSKDNK